MFSDNNIKKKPVFVYGTLKQGYFNHNILKSLSFDIEKAEANGTMYSLTSFPAVKFVGKNKIKGELIKFKNRNDFIKGISLMDLLEGHPNFYKRITIETDKGSAYSYEYTGMINKEIVKEGEWK